MDIKFILRFSIAIFLVFGVVLGGVFGAAPITGTVSQSVVPQQQAQTTASTPASTLTGNVANSKIQQQTQTPSTKYLTRVVGDKYFIYPYDENTDVKDGILNYVDPTPGGPNIQIPLKSGFVSDDVNIASIKGKYNTNKLDKETIEKIPATEIMALPLAEKEALIKLANDEGDGYLNSIFSAFTQKMTATTLGAKTVDEVSKNTAASCSGCSAAQYNTEYEKQLNSKLSNLCSNALNSNKPCSCSLNSCDLNVLSQLDKDIYNSIKNNYDKKTQVETNGIYKAISILTNPDENALKASKLFGLDEAFNFKDNALYDVFGEPFPSNICIAKIDGYLDDQQNTNGGVTSYQFGTDDPDEKLSERSINVRYDLRAQMTRVTPDAKVSISYSYFVKAPFEEDLQFIIAVSYVADNKVKKVALTDLKSIKGGEKSNGFETVDLPLNSTNVDENSFQIGLVAVDSTKSPVYSVTTPIILITSGTNNYNINSGSGNSQGNTNAQSNANSFGVEDMLNLI